MSNLACGHSFSIATPHFKSSMTAMAEYLDSHAAPCAALGAAISLTYNLPHLCGLGGDAIILQSHNRQLEVINGTGKTALHQHYNAYIDKGLNTIPRRGLYSTMVYGCPSAYDRYSQAHDIDLRRVFNHLSDHDLNYPPAMTDSLSASLLAARHESSPHIRFPDWHHDATSTHRCNAAHRQTLATVAREGFSSFYSGLLAEQVYGALSSCDTSLYTPADFSEFEANACEIRVTRFMQATIAAHGSNSPWRELFLLLKLYELSTLDTHPLSPRQTCTAAGLIDAALAAQGETHDTSDNELNLIAALLYQQLKFDDPMPVPQSSKPSHTIFMACAEADGTLTGITNSIYTPLGALFEVENTGILLANRAFSFNGPQWAATFTGRTAAKHTTNCVRVTTDDLEFIIGTSGGPVQCQTLAFIIHKIVAEHYPVHKAIAAPRQANLGRHPKTGCTTYLSECYLSDPVFTVTPQLCEKLGVVQLAGINRLTGQVFAAADPRSTGIALAV